VSAGGAVARWSNAAQCVTAIDLHVSRRLLAARTAAGISQERAAEPLDITFQQLQKYERGVNRISAGKLAMLAQLYGKPIAWFFEGIVDAIDHLTVAKDTTAEMMSAPYGADLVRDYLAIQHNQDRHIVATVAAALARKNGSAS
jgi:transcriptional regulator with XRE-family HTH domain